MRVQRGGGNGGAGRCGWRVEAMVVVITDSRCGMRVTRSVLPLLPNGERHVEHVLHAAGCALSTAEAAVRASSVAAVRAARVDEAGVWRRWCRSLEVWYVGD